MNQVYIYSMFSATRYIWVFAVLALHVALCVVLAMDPLMGDNGDYHRVIGKIIDVKSVAAPDACQNFYEVYKGGRIRSTMEGFFLSISGAVKILGMDCMPAKLIVWINFAIFCAGSFWAIWWDRKNVFLICCVTVLAIIFSPLMASNYEEAILPALVVWCIGGHSRMIKTGKAWYFLLPAAFLVYSKVQMVFFAPLYIYILYRVANDRHIQRTSLRWGAAIIFFVALAILSAKAPHQRFNSYNRLYNGIGWSELRVNEWPKKNFIDRHTYSYANLPALQAAADLHILDPQFKHLLGTSYWPSGSEILELDDQSSIELKKALKDTLKPVNYLRTLMSPGVLPDFIGSVYLVAFSSDYTLHYLRIKPAPLWARPFVGWKDQLLSNSGWVYLVFSMVCVACLRGGKERLIGATVLALMPLVVAVGDGFYEYEKHLLTFFMAIPLVLLIGRPSNPFALVELGRRVGNFRRDRSSAI